MSFQVELVRLENVTTNEYFHVVLRCGDVEAQAEKIPETITMNDTNGEYVYFDLWTMDWVWQGSGRFSRESIRQSRSKPVKLRRVVITSNLTLVIRVTQLIELNLDLSTTSKMNEDVSILNTTSRWTESLRERRRKKRRDKVFQEEKSSFLSTRRLEELATPKRSTKRVQTHHKHTKIAFGRHETKDISDMKRSKTLQSSRRKNTRLLHEKLKTRRRKKKRRVKPRECTHGRGPGFSKRPWRGAGAGTWCVLLLFHWEFHSHHTRTQVQCLHNDKDDQESQKNRVIISSVIMMRRRRRRWSGNDFEKNCIPLFIRFYNIKRFKPGPWNDSYETGRRKWNRMTSMRRWRKRRVMRTYFLQVSQFQPYVLFENVISHEFKNFLLGHQHHEHRCTNFWKKKERQNI